MKNHNHHHRSKQRRQRSGNQVRTKERSNELHQCSGVLEMHPSGYGFLRRLDKNLKRLDDDTFVPESTIQRYKLRAGVLIRGSSQAARRGAGPRLVRIDDVNGIDPKSYGDIEHFDELVPTNPKDWLRLENPDGPVSMRMLDLLCPFGMGQRALIASPPKAGKTTLLKQIGRSVAQNYPDVHLAVLLVDERPEEVTDMLEEIDAEIFASNLDQDASSHVRLARLVINRCQRLAELGEDVFLLVDSLTRLTRACNKMPGLNAAMGPGGLNIRALDFPKQLFASARSFRGSGSLTIVASVLIATDNRMDEVIFREFKGTGNLDLVLSPQLAERRIWPAVDIQQSGTRRVELLHDPSTFRATTALRNTLISMQPMDAAKELIEKLARFKTNAEFVKLIVGQI